MFELHIWILKKIRKNLQKKNTETFFCILFGIFFCIFFCIFIHGRSYYQIFFISLNSSLCLINYEKLKEDIVKELKPCLQFIGFDISHDMESCINEEQEGNHHRPPMSQQDLQSIINQTFTQQELLNFTQTYQNVLSKVVKK